MGVGFIRFPQKIFMSVEEGFFEMKLGLEGSKRDLYLQYHKINNKQYLVFSDGLLKIVKPYIHIPPNPLNGVLLKFKVFFHIYWLDWGEGE